MSRFLQDPRSRLWLPSRHSQRGFLLNPARFAVASGGAGAWNPAKKSPYFTLSNGDRTATHASQNAAVNIRSYTAQNSGKWYFELNYTLTSGSLNTAVVGGIRKASDAVTTSKGAGTRSLISLGSNTATVEQTTGGTFNGSWSAPPANAVIMFAVDLTLNRLWAGRNGTWVNSGNPGAGTGYIHSNFGTGPWEIACEIDDTRSFIGAVLIKSASANLTYSVPSGFTAWG